MSRCPPLLPALLLVLAGCSGPADPRGAAPDPGKVVEPPKPPPPERKVAGKTWPEWAAMLSADGKPGVAEAVFRASREDHDAAKALLGRLGPDPTPASLALLSLSDDEAVLVPALEKMLVGPAPPLKGAVEQHLFRLGKAGPMLDDTVKQAQAGDKSAIARLAERRAAPTVEMLALLEHRDAAVRAEVARSWLKLPPRALSAVSAHVAGLVLRKPDDANWLVPLLVRPLGRDGALALLQRVVAEPDARIMAELPRPAAAGGPPRDLASRIRGASDEEREEIAEVFRKGIRVEEPGRQADILAALKEVPSQEETPRRPGERTLLMRWLAVYGTKATEDEREPMARLVKSSQQKVKTEAAMALARMGSRDKAVLTALTLAAESYPDREVRRDAMYALALFGAGAEPALEDLETYAKDREADAAAAGAALAAIGKPAMPTVLRLLADPKGRASAAEAIIRLGPAAEGALKPLLEGYKAAGGDGVTKARLPYAHALGALGAAAAEIAPGLLTHVEKKAEAGRFDLSAFHSFSTLLRVGGTPDEKVAALVKKYLASGGDPASLVVALEPLGEKMRPLLPELLKVWESRKDVKYSTPGGEAADTFARLGSWAIEALADSAARSAVTAGALHRVGRAAVPVAVKRLASPDAAARGVALAFLAERATAAEVTALAPLLASKDDAERALAVRALARAGLKEDAALRRAAEDAAPAVAVAGIRALRERGKPHEKASERLQELVKSTAVRDEAARELAFVKMPPAEAAALLYPLLPNEAVRRTLAELAPGAAD